MQLGLELEYWTVDNTGALASAQPVLDRIDDLDAESADPMLEVVTDPCDSVAELQAEVTARLQEAITVAREEHRRLVPLGTPLNTDSITTNESPRTRIQQQILGKDFANATYCAGTHLHVDQIAGRETDQLNLLTALDPAMALVSSSSHHQGDAVASCARPQIYRQECYRDYPQLGQLWPYAESKAEWEDRITVAFDQFQRRALAAGVDPATFNDHFTPEDSIWAPIRLREKFETIEWRAPDATLPGQILQLITDIRDALEVVVDHGLEIGDQTGITTDSVTIPEFEQLRHYVQTAMDSGLGSPVVGQYLHSMGFDLASYQPLSHDLEHLPQISQHNAKRLRLQYASQLEWEVKALATNRLPTQTAVTQSKRQRRVPAPQK